MELLKRHRRTLIAAFIGSLVGIVLAKVLFSCGDT